MERETKTITTPKGKELIVKTYLTARERNELRNIYLSTMKIDKSGEVIDGFSGSLMETAERKLLEIVVISYAGNKENILNNLLDEIPEEYDFVVAESGKVNGGNFQSAK